MTHDPKYARYLPPQRGARWATRQEICRALQPIVLAEATYPTSGFPVIAGDGIAYMDGSDTHSIVFGATGSKKTRLIVMPTLHTIMRAGESFVVTDPKGELYQRTSGFAAECGYRVLTLNFRDPSRSHCWNPLYKPFELYHSSRRSACLEMLNDLVASVCIDNKKNRVDPFWENASASLGLANLLLLMECGTVRNTNVVSWTRMAAGDQIEAITNLIALLPTECLARINYAGVLSGSEKTIDNILVSLFASLRIFVMNEELASMLSRNDIDMASIGTCKTALYLILPDEKTTSNFLITVFVKQLYETLIAQAQKEERLCLARRVNFVLDEFCNIPTIPDMPSMISAARSRNIRFYLIAQGMRQLQEKYGEDAFSIRGNCTNWVFLTSRELPLLQEFSQLCGERCLDGNRVQPLITPSELQFLNKQRGEALMFVGRQHPYISYLPDIDDYVDFQQRPPLPLPRRRATNHEVFSLQKTLNEIIRCERSIPFTKNFADRGMTQ